MKKIIIALVVLLIAGGAYLLWNSQRPQRTDMGEDMNGMDPNMSGMDMQGMMQSQ